MSAITPELYKRWTLLTKIALNPEELKLELAQALSQALLSMETVSLENSTLKAELARLKAQPGVASRQGGSATL